MHPQSMPKVSTVYLIGLDGEKREIGTGLINLKTAVIEAGIRAEKSAMAMRMFLDAHKTYTINAKVLLTNNSRRWAGQPLRRRVAMKKTRRK